MILDDPGRLHGITGVHVRWRQRDRVREGDVTRKVRVAWRGARVKECWPPLKAVEGRCSPRASEEMQCG